MATMKYTVSVSNVIYDVEFTCIGKLHFVDNQIALRELNRMADATAKELATQATPSFSEKHRMRVVLPGGEYGFRMFTITYRLSMIGPKCDSPKTNKRSTKVIPVDKPFGKSYLASYIHASLKATAKNMVTDSELTKLSAEIATMQSKLNELEKRKAEMEKNRKVATNEHDAFTHLGKLLENAFGIGYKFVGAEDEKFCKVLKFQAYGESKELPISVYMVNEKVTEAHNVRSTNTVMPMPIIHVMNADNVMVPISDLTPEEICNLLR